MLVFQYDKSFEGLLSAVFDAYAGKAFPERLIGPGEPEPMFMSRLQTVETTRAKADRVWRGLQKKMVSKAPNMLMHVWLSEIAGVDELLFRFVRKNLGLVKQAYLFVAALLAGHAELTPFTKLELFHQPRDMLLQLLIFRFRNSDGFNCACIIFHVLIVSQNTSISKQ